MRMKIAWLTGLAAFAMLLTVCAGAQAKRVGIRSFEVESSTSQAGGHPDVHFYASFDNRNVENEEFAEPEFGTCFCHDVQQADTHFPTGFIGNPHAVPECTLEEFSNKKCSPDTQVGVLEFQGVLQLPIYNVEPHPGQPGLLAFPLPILNAPGFIDLHARTGSDYGLDATTVQIFHFLPISNLDVHIWGVPASPAHDYNRQPSPQVGCFAEYAEPCPGASPSNAQEAPYLENPTSCGVPLTGSVDLAYYDDSLYHADAPWPMTSGCDLLDFNPSLTAKPTTEQADTAAGLDVNLTVPQSTNPGVPAPSELRASTVTLPEGFAINPNAADGKTACSDQQAAFGTEDEAQCPETSKVGTIVLDSSALPAPIPGAIYLGTPEPGNPYRLILAADGFSTHVKLRGSVQTDPGTGRIVVSFADLPQSPFQEFDMHFFGSERGLLVTPEKCGTYPVESEFVPWDGLLSNQHSTSFFHVTSGPNGESCPGSPRPFDPGFISGTSDNTAGKFSPLGIEVTRPDGSQILTGVQVTMPEGISASLKGVPYCPEAAIAQLADPARTGIFEQASPACPAASQIGTVITSTGAGSHPLYTEGHAYLAGTYKGAPLSLVIVVPAVSGPYDLGNVVVRSAIRVDRVSAQITTVSDEIPRILGGIPLRIRSIRVRIDRHDFTVNPTNCSPSALTAWLTGGEGGSATRQNYFQMANCSNLPFAPSLSLRLSGGSARLGHPALHATLRSKPGEANIGRAAVALPPAEQLDQSHIRTTCSRFQLAAEHCPADSIYGETSATSPLLDAPLSGHVYLVASNNHLPDLVAALRGQIAIDLYGRIDTVNGGLRATFANPPDVPVSTFRLDMQGGGKGLLVNSSSLCGKPKRANAEIVGQNEAKANQRPKLRAGCGKSGRRKHRGRMAA
jgi:hypothetical protein